MVPSLVSPSVYSRVERRWKWHVRWIVGNAGNVAGMWRMWRGGPGGNRGGDCVEARSVGHFLKCVLWEVELKNLGAVCLTYLRMFSWITNFKAPQRRVNQVK